MIEHLLDGCQCEGKKCFKCEKVLCVGAFYRQFKDNPLLRTDCKECFNKRKRKPRKSPEKRMNPQPDLENLKTRFLSYVEIQSDGCWIWKGGIYKRRGDGYGRIRMPNHGPYVRSHRVSYELYKGPIPEGLVIDHLCGVRLCVNPDHLEAVTLGENSRRGIGTSRIVSRDLYAVCKDVLQAFEDHPELPDDVRKALIDAITKAERLIGK